MKRLKDFLILFIPLAVFTALPIIMFATSTGDNAIIDNSQYLKLFLKDSMLWKTLAGTYIRALIFTLAFGIAVAALCAFIKAIRRRKVFYPVCIAGSAVIAFFYLYSSKKAFFGMPMGVYDPSYLVNNTVPETPVSIYEIFIALQIAFLTALIFFFVETIYRVIKNKK